MAHTRPASKSQPAVRSQAAGRLVQISDSQWILCIVAHVLRRAPGERSWGRTWPTSIAQRLVSTRALRVEQLRRSAAAHDIERVRSVLQAALHGGWTEGPAIRQALALLRRATLLARRSLGESEISSRCLTAAVHS